MYKLGRIPRFGRPAPVISVKLDADSFNQRGRDEDEAKATGRRGRLEMER